MKMKLDGRAGACPWHSHWIHHRCSAWNVHEWKKTLINILDLELSTSGQKETFATRATQKRRHQSGAQGITHSQVVIIAITILFNSDVHDFNLQDQVLKK